MIAWTLYAAIVAIVWMGTEPRYGGDYGSGVAGMYTVVFFGFLVLLAAAVAIALVSPLTVGILRSGASRF